jgi:hypothetical protein
MAKLTEFRKEIPTSAVWLTEWVDPDTRRWEIMSGIAYATRDEARDEIRAARKRHETKFCTTRWIRSKEAEESVEEKT